MKKRILSALMAISMYVSAVPMAVCAENDTNAGHLEYTKKFCDECLLDPEENETNRLIYNLAKAKYDDIKAYEAEYSRSYYDEFLGVYKTDSGRYKFYCLSYEKDNDTIPGHDDIKCSQYICLDRSILGICYIDNPYITEEEFNSLSYDEKFITAAKIFDETGEYITTCISPCIGTFPTYVGEDGKGYNQDGYEWNIVDREEVLITGIKFDNVDILEPETLTGDANLDGDVDIADAVFIMQSLSNPDEYKLSEQGRLNADYNGDGGVTALDALEIQMLMIS